MSSTADYPFKAWIADLAKERKDGRWYQILPASHMFQEVTEGSFKRVQARRASDSPAWFDEVVRFDKASCGVAEIRIWAFKFNPNTTYRLFLRVHFDQPVLPPTKCMPIVQFTTPCNSADMDEWRRQWQRFEMHIHPDNPFSVDAVILSPQGPEGALPAPTEPLSSISGDVKPLRLINIVETLRSNGGVVFKQAESWDFHVISHTWSKDIRAFSESIGAKLTQSGFSSSYEELFNEGGFSAEPAYKSLMEFLQILKSDGVTDVWFDALCINQQDHEEKDKEIAHMGAYYRHSKACYVSKCGFGKGYKLATRQMGGGYGIARYFRRAWTFQEYVLPHRMIFLADCIPRRVQRMVNYCLRSTSHSMVCQCSLFGMRQTLFRAQENLQFVEPNGEVVNDMMGSDIDVPCSKCSQLPFIRMVKLTGLGCKSPIYFIDRDFYGFLISCFHSSIICAEDYMNHVWLPAGNQTMLQSISLPTYGRDAWGGIVYGLEKVVQRGDSGRGEGFFLDGIKTRNVTNQEDMLLSILALMGMEGSTQVRTGKELYEQYVQLAHAASPHLLVEICTNCMHPHVDGLSWIPVMNTVCHLDLPITHMPFGRGRIMATVQKEEEPVTPQGFLRLCGKATRARLLFVTSSIHLHDASSCASFCMPCHSSLTGMGGPCPNNGSADQQNSGHGDAGHCSATSVQGSCSRKDNQSSGRLSHVHMKCLIEAASVHMANIHCGEKLQLELEANVFLGAMHSCGVIVTYRGRSAFDQRDEDGQPYCDGGICIPGCISIQDLMRYKHMDVWLLHMGERFKFVKDVIVPLGVRSHVVMVCIGSLENLHKIGVMNIDPVFSASVFAEDDMISYALGGLDMSGFRHTLDSVHLDLSFGNRISSSCRTCGGGGEWCHGCYRRAFATASSPLPKYKPTRADIPMALCCMACGKFHQNYRFHKFLSQL